MKETELTPQQVAATTALANKVPLGEIFNEQVMEILNHEA
jgi:hypothetical protein